MECSQSFSELGLIGARTTGSSEETQGAVASLRATCGDCETWGMELIHLKYSSQDLGAAHGSEQVLVDEQIQFRHRRVVRSVTEST